MARTLRSDKLLFGATVGLVSISVVMVFSASAATAFAEHSTPAYYFAKQLAWAVIGIGLMLTAMRIDYHRYNQAPLIWGLLAVTAIALVAVFGFGSRNGTHRWLILGPISLQPSEAAKLTVILFAAALLERRMHRINEIPYALMPIMVVTGAVAGLILAEPDFGTSAMVITIVAAMLFTAGLSYRYVIGAALLLLPAAMVIVITAAYRMRRILSFLDPWEDAQGSGYQAVQSFIALGSGGLLGRGLMNGVQKLFYLPYAHTDFIFAVVGEELGLIGTTGILICFVVIAWRGLRAALLAPDRYGSLLAVGLTTMVAVQGFINMSVNIGLLPTKGIPLPFVSNGGSSLIVNLVAMGILLNISQQASPVAAAAIEARK